MVFRMRREIHRGIGGHHSARSYTCDWLTPPEIIQKIGEFDLDPCSPVKRPWDTAKRHYSIEDDGLSQPWEGRVWLNPPYGLQAWPWMSRLADHGDGVAILFARTETRGFHRLVWERATALLFLEGRLNFHRATGERADRNAGGPSVLIAYGNVNAWKLEHSGIPGKFIWLMGGA